MRFIGDDVANGNIGAAQQHRPTMIQIGGAELPLRHSFIKPDNVANGEYWGGAAAPPYHDPKR
jgi:hypothetical protein